jgi:hypothetical protein
MTGKPHIESGEEHAVPWNKLTYDTNLGGYRTDITEQQLRGAPSFLAR